MSRFLFVFWIACILSINCCFGEPAPGSKLDLLFAPLIKWAKVSQKTEKPPDHLYAKQINALLPGALYDVRELFANCGVKFAGNDFAWFHPKSLTLVVRTSPENIGLMSATLDSASFNLMENLVLQGRIRVKSLDDSKKTESTVARWRVYSESGMEAQVSTKGGKNLTYRFHIQPTIRANGADLDYQMELKVKFAGREYTTRTSAATPLGKQQIFLMGITQKNEGVFFDFMPTVESVISESKWPYADPAKKKQLLEAIERNLKQPPAAGG